MRIAACVEYDGSRFCGWQIQKDGRTVQQTVEAALTKVANEPIRIICAGRTDTGVHACGQIIHFDTQAERSLRSWVLGGNANLPNDVSLLWAHHADADFHARFSAQSRHYRYVILNRWVRSALLRDKVCWDHRPLNHDLMQDAAQALLGEHDFSSFRALACQAKSPVRTIHNIRVQKQGEYISIDVEANAFLHHMVRNIAGVLMTVGASEQPVEWCEKILNLRDRTQGGVTAPPNGLYLVRVAYDAKFALPDVINLPQFS